MWSNAKLLVWDERIPHTKALWLSQIIANVNKTNMPREWCRSLGRYNNGHGPNAENLKVSLLCQWDGTIGLKHGLRPLYKHILITTKLYLPWRFDLCQRPSSEEVVLLPVLATVVMWCGKKSIVCVVQCIAALVPVHRTPSFFPMSTASLIHLVPLSDSLSRTVDSDQWFKTFCVLIRSQTSVLAKDKVTQCPTVGQVVVLDCIISGEAVQTVVLNVLPFWHFQQMRGGV